VCPVVFSSNILCVIVYQSTCFPIVPEWIWGDNIGFNLSVYLSFMYFLMEYVLFYHLPVNICGNCTFLRGANFVYQFCSVSFLCLLCEIFFDNVSWCICISLSLSTNSWFAILYLRVNVSCGSFQSLFSEFFHSFIKVNSKSSIMCVFSSSTSHNCLHYVPDFGVVFV